jgi:hypothetical protein
LSYGVVATGGLPENGESEELGRTGDLRETASRSFLDDEDPDHEPARSPPCGAP